MSAHPEIVLPESICAGCGVKTNAASDLLGRDVPSPGSVSMCMRCAHIALFNADLTLREPNKEELFTILTTPETQRGIVGFLVYRQLQENGYV